MKEMIIIFSTLKMDSLAANERIDALLSLKKAAASVPECKLTKEIIQLCEREAELLMRGINPTLLNGLRSVCAQIYWDYGKYNKKASEAISAPFSPFIYIRHSYIFDIYMFITWDPHLTTTHYQIVIISIEFWF